MRLDYDTAILYRTLMEHTKRIDQPVMSSGSPEPQRPFYENWIVTTGIVVFLILTFCFLSTYHSSGSSTTTDTSSNTSSQDPAEVGDTRTIASKNIACASTIEKFEAFAQAAVANDNDGMTEALADGVSLTPGTRVLMIAQSGFLPPLIKLRILAGPNQGRACWTDESTQGLFR